MFLQSFFVKYYQKVVCNIKISIKLIIKRFEFKYDFNFINLSKKRITYLEVFQWKAATFFDLIILVKISHFYIFIHCYSLEVQLLKKLKLQNLTVYI